MELGGFTLGCHQQAPPLAQIPPPPVSPLSRRSSVTFRITRFLAILSKLAHQELQNVPSQASCAATSSHKSRKWSKQVCTHDGIQCALRDGPDGDSTPPLTHPAAGTGDEAVSAHADEHVDPVYDGLNRIDGRSRGATGRRATDLPHRCQYVDMLRNTSLTLFVSRQLLSSAVTPTSGHRHL